MKRSYPICLLLGIAMIASGLMARCAAAQTTAPSDIGDKTAIVELTGEINDFNRDQFFRRIDQAEQLGAKTIIVNLDTYGGLVTSGLEISRYLKRQSNVHTVAFIQDKAISAGAMIAMACDEIVMSPSATLGDCAPIVFQFDGKLEDLPAAERAKQESPILADFEESAMRNHHDLLLARAMVAVQISIYWVQSPTGERRFVDKDDHAALLKSGWMDVPGVSVPIDSDQTLLTVDSQHAVMYGLASGQSYSAAQLASDRRLNVVADYHTTEGDKLVEWIGSWPARLLLIIIFLSCANIVLHAPGHGVAEVVGLGALLLMLGVPMLTGYAQWWEILAVFVGLALVAVEILLPGHFVPGIVGACLVIFGLIFTFVPKEPSGAPWLPQMQGTWIALQHGAETVAAALAISFICWIFMNRFLPKAPLFNRLIIHSTSGGTAPTALAEPLASTEISWPWVGSRGRSLSELKPGGSAAFVDNSTGQTRVTAVVSDSGFVAPGTEICVREVAGNRIVVRPV